MSDTDLLPTEPVAAHVFLPGAWREPPVKHHRPRRSFGWLELAVLVAGLAVMPLAAAGAYQATMWWRHLDANPVIVGTASPSPAAVPLRHHHHARHSAGTLPVQPVNQTAPAGGTLPAQPVPLPAPPHHQPRHHHPPPVSPPPSPLPSPSPSPSPDPSPDPSPSPSPTTPTVAPSPPTAAASPT